MAVEKGNAKYDAKFNYSHDDEKKTKTLSTINYNGTGSGGGSSALGLDDQELLSMAKFIGDSIIGGAQTGAVTLVSSESLVEV